MGGERDVSQTERQASQCPFTRATFKAQQVSAGASTPNLRVFLIHLDAGAIKNM